MQRLLQMQLLHLPVNDMRVVLASGSPRRKTLIKKIVDEVEIITADVDERKIEEPLRKRFEGAPQQDAAAWISMELAMAKAKAVFEKIGCPEDTVVIGADTSVALSDEILGKPVDRDDAVRMLRKESLEPQYVLTGVALVSSWGERKFAASSRVVFNPLDEAQEARIQAYCDLDEPYDKAGAYGLQDHADTLVKCYEGSFDNIVGLPTEKLKEEFEKYCKESNNTL